MEYEVIFNYGDGTYDVVRRPDGVCVYASTCEDDAYYWIDTQDD